MDDQGFVTIGKYKVKVDRDLCIGAGSCVAIADKTYSLDGENKAILHADSVNTPEEILMAAQSCPTKAIIIIDIETGKQVWPTS
ncbi:MAG: ferredoxin [bacterium]|nr:ferredoxin [bacterium]